MAKILIVDDQIDFHTTLCKFAARLGHEVESAEDAGGAIELGRIMVPDILFVDWMLNSRLDGLDVVRILGEDISNLIAVVMTGDLSLELSSALVEAGRTSILRKPFGLGDFEAAIDAATLRSANEPDIYGH